MPNSLYHLQRLTLSYAFEYFMTILGWVFSIKHPYWINVLVGLSCVGCGAAFAIAPQDMAAYFQFTQLNLTAITDIRAFYGTMLIAMGLVILYLAQREESARASLWFILALALGSAIGRVIGFMQGETLWGIHGLLAVFELSLSALVVYFLKRPQHAAIPAITPLNPTHPEQFNPLSDNNFRNPYAYYKLLRDDFPVYHFAAQNFYVLSRYQDIVDYTKNTDLLSNKLVEIIVMGKPKDPRKTSPSIIERLGDLGIIPVDVLALQDPPIHQEERKISHKLLSSHRVKELEADVEQLCDEMMDAFLAKGTVEFIQEFAWRLPMRLVISMLGLPDKDYEIIKQWCCESIRSLSGTTTAQEQILVGASNARFTRYLWQEYLRIKKEQPDTFTAQLGVYADDPNSVMTDQRAVATLLQLLIAGSDSSASTMGSAIKTLLEQPELEQRLRRNPEDIPAFIDEVLRMEAAFQGHFRLTRETCEIHGVTLPAASRIFMCWASGNRDERFWDNPDVFDMDRANLKRHLTFGHGVHACVGRELARMENRIVIKKLLEKTRRIAIAGDTPYEASLFARTLVRLPLAFEVA